MRATRTLVLSLTVTVAGLLGGGAIAFDPDEPLAGVRIAYVHLDQQDEREAWGDFLTDQGATFTGIPVHLAAATNWSLFDLVIVAEDTYQANASDGQFGVAGFADSDAIFGSGLPILALFSGSAIFDDIPELAAIGRGQHAGYDRGDVIALPASFWNVPLKNPVVPGAVVELRAVNDAGGDALWWVGPGAAGAVIFALQSDDDQYAPLSGILGSYRVWGFGGAPGDLTPLGRRVFINYLYSLLPQPELDYHAVVPGAARAP